MAKKSYFILQPIRPKAKEKTDLFWTQDVEAFITFIDRNLDALKKNVNRLRFYWRNREISFDKLMQKREKLIVIG